MKGTNTCQWLLLGTTDLCGRSCMGMHCKVHFARLRKGPGTCPCTGCGVGVKNVFALFGDCGYYRALKRKWISNARAREFNRLAAIEIYI